MVEVQQHIVEHNLCFEQHFCLKNKIETNEPQ